MRDNSLARHLRELGHDVSMLPMYLPRFLDEEAVNEDSPIFFGGSNVYLQYKFSLFRHTPAWVDRFFDSNWLLRKAAARSSMTDGKELGEITLAMFKGEDGPIAKEVGKVINWFRKNEKPDVVLLSTILLAGLGRVIRRKLGVPVLGFLQGEDSFLDSLPDDYSEHAWALLSEDIAKLDGCIAPSRYFGQEMRKRLKFPEKQLHFLPNGISFDGYTPRNSPPEKPSIGFLARMCPLKGLHVLVDAYIEIMKRGNHPELELRIAGGMTDEDKPYVEEQKKKLRASDLWDKTSFSPNVDRDEKIAFLRDLTAFTVPSQFPEAFGLYVLEALASGVPVVLPDDGAFPELVETTKGGVIYEPNDSSALAHALERLISQPNEAHAMGLRGHEIVGERFSNKRLATELVDNVLAQIPALA